MPSGIIIVDDQPLFRTAPDHAVAQAWPNAETVDVASGREAREALLAA